MGVFCWGEAPTPPSKPYKNIFVNIIKTIGNRYYGIMKKVLVFGVFDGIHDGHRSFLREAKGMGDWLVAAVARDETTVSLKNRKAQRNLAERMAALEGEGFADEVVAGDRDLGSWAIIEKHKPDVVVLGYDQEALKKAFEEFLKQTAQKIEVAVMMPHKPDKYHTSIIINQLIS